jgi:bifunctional DNA-binding transcriptional regulator/antitoxin component of YhaV-PrlF toxin-antitoxin module
MKTQHLDVHIAANGRMVLPRAVRDALGVKGAGVVVVSLEGTEVKLSSMRQSIRRAQALYRAEVANDQTSEDFLRARRKESATENKAQGRTK